LLRKLKSQLQQNAERVRALSLAFSTVAVKSVVNLVTVKLIAAFAGPSALSFYSQVLSVNALASTFTTGSLTTGLVKITAEHSEKEDMLFRIRATVLKLNIALGFILSLVFFLFRSRISELLFGITGMQHIVSLLGIASFFSGLNLIFSSYANGLVQYKFFLRLSIVSSCILLVAICIAGLIRQLDAFLYAFLFAQIVSILVMLPALVQKGYIHIRDYRNRVFDKKILISLGGFGLMSLAATLMVNLSQIFIRLFLSRKFSVEGAGLWDAMTKLSGAYFSILTAGLGIYYLPKIVSCKTRIEIDSEIIAMIKLIVPALIIFFVIIFLSREYLILLLYSKEFMPIKPFFLPILVSDFFKWFGWLFSYIIMAKSSVRLYLINEITITIILMVAVYLSSEMFGMIGVFYAYSLVFFIYFLTSLFLSRKVINSQ
jgi:O-antigen/teichoic acid export membrane protein